MAISKTEILPALQQLNTVMFDWFEMTADDRSQHTKYQTPEYWNFVYADRQIGMWQHRSHVDLPLQWPYPKLINTTVTF